MTALHPAKFSDQILREIDRLLRSQETTRWPPTGRWSTSSPTPGSRKEKDMRWKENPMTDSCGPLVPHPDRPHVWVRARLQGEWTETIRSGDREEVFADRATKRTAPLWHHVTVWTSVAASGWLTFLVARAVMDAAVGVLGLGGSALAAAGVGAVSGVVGWAVERKP